MRTAAGALAPLVALLAAVLVQSSGLPARNPSAPMSRMRPGLSLRKPSLASRFRKQLCTNAPHHRTSGALTGRHRSSRVKAVFGDNGDPNSPIAKLKEVFSRYGVVAIIFHSIVWSLTLTTSYLLVSNDLPVEDYLPHSIQDKIPSKAGDLALAYLATEATGPLRTILTLSAAPFVAKQWENIRGSESST